jgi:hypothetical protein
LATISKDSIRGTCALCSQFSAFLVQDGLSLNDSIELWCYHVQEGTWRNIYFSIPYHHTHHRLNLLGTQALYVERDTKTLPEKAGLTSSTELVSGETHRTPLGHQCDAVTPDYTQLSGWMDSCRARHESICGAQDHQGATPRRLINCETSQVCVGTHQPYVCLSYVWGVASSQGNDPRTGVSGFLQTVCDAISVTRRLGYGYLWVDRYCIDQHDSEDKHSAIRSMGSICTYALVYVISVRPWFAASIGNQAIPDSIPGRVRIKPSLRNTYP